jgi:hypothetical protein
MTSEDRCYCGARGTRAVVDSAHNSDGAHDTRAVADSAHNSDGPYDIIGPLIL